MYGRRVGLGIKNKSWIVKILLLCFIAAGIVGYGERVDAHASLLSAVPEPNGTVAKPPEAITLTFNERLEGQLYYIKVLDEIGRDAVKRDAVLSEDRKQVSLKLPELTDGLYTVTYHVVSADGHPVQGTYALIIGQAQTRGDPAAANEAALHEGHSLTAEMSTYDVIKYITRMAYYIALVALAGWVFWGIAARLTGRERTTAASDRYRFWSVIFQRAHLLTLLLLIATHYSDLLGDQGLDKLLGLFLGTTVGQYWCLALVWSLAGFALLHRYRWLDGIWLTSLLLAKSFNGHAMSYGPGLTSVAVDFVHLLAAAVWAGGLWLLLVVRKADPEFVRSFAPRFSRAALASLVLLVVTGVVATQLFLPSPSYLLYSQWGFLLLLKVGLVLLVVVVGAVLRIALRKKGELSRTLVGIDFGLMTAIMMIVGLLTFISPVPPNEPLYWHEMGKTIHMTTRITPNVPGPDNTFFVQVWLTEQNGPPKAVQLRLKSMDKSELAPIEIPLQAEAPDDDPAFIGADQLQRYAFRTSGPFLPYPGLWQIEVRVMDKNDDERVYQKEIRLY
jgi:copper transport protein